MLRKLIIIISVLLISNCSANWASKEAKTSGKATAASGRINASDSNSQNIFKELE